MLSVKEIHYLVRIIRFLLRCHDYFRQSKFPLAVGREKKSDLHFSPPLSNSISYRQNGGFLQVLGAFFCLF